MKLIYTHENVLVLHSAKNVLALNSIESFVKNEHTIPISARHGISNIFHELWIIHDKDYAKVSTVIENEVANPEPKEPWLCAECNEENDGSFEVCWNCQTVQPRAQQ